MPHLAPWLMHVNVCLRMHTQTHKNRARTFYSLMLPLPGSCYLFSLVVWRSGNGREESALWAAGASTTYGAADHLGHARQYWVVGALAAHR